MTDKYYILNYKINFRAVRAKDRELSNVECILVFFPKNEQSKKQTYKIITDTTGTVQIQLVENGILHIFVKGYENIKSKTKEVMKPLLADGDSVVKIDDDILLRNEKFITKEEYDTARCRSPKNDDRISYNLFYEEYKKQNTRYFDKKKTLVFKSYIWYQFVDSNEKGIPIIEYQIFAEGQEKPIVGDYPIKVHQDQRAKGVPKEHGFTQYVETLERTFVKYKLGSNAIKSPYFDPITCVDLQEIYKIVIPTTQAITKPDPNHTVGLSKVEKPRVVISPHDNQVLFLAPELYDDFDRQTKVLSDAINKVYQNSADLQKAIQYRDPKEIKELEARLGLSQELALKKLNAEIPEKEQLKEVWVVEKKGKMHQVGAEHTIKVRHLNANAYQKMAAQKRNKASKVNLTGENMNQYTPQKIKEGFDHLGHELMNESGSLGSEEKVIYDLVGGLGGEVAEAYLNRHDMYVSNEAQWLRLVTGLNAEGSLHVGDKGVAIRGNGNASAKFALYEGMKEWRRFFPSPDGWTLEYDNHDLGTIRFLVGMDLSTFAGANIALAGNLSVDIYQDANSNQQYMRAANRRPDRSMTQQLGRDNRPTFNMAQGTLEKIEANKKGSTNQLNVGVQAFVGATAQCLLKGAIEWFKPSQELGKNGQGEFVIIASVTAGLGVSGGFGVAGQFQMGYDDESGTFAILVAAHLCAKVGAKGVVGFTVGAAHLPDYVSFIKLKLLQIGFKTLVYMQAQAFEMMARVLAYCIGENKPLAQKVSELAGEYKRWLDKLNSDQVRLRVAENTNSAAGRKALIDAPPESKGILLYAVTHWSDRTAAIFDSNLADGSFSRLVDGSLETFVARKTAVINILKTCLTQAEWHNTIQHIHPRGKKLNCDQLGKVEGDLVRFLNHHHDGAIARKAIDAVNTNVPHSEDQFESPWLKDYLKYRQAASQVTEPSCHYMLVSSQDDIRFKQMIAQQGIQSAGFNTPTLTAKNHHEMAAFESPQDTPTQQA
ncbi:hypothetical protein [Acinetobacter boissieri]|uniref:Uncharacterized protein n=1 Tax=Acinetobacter boissieri TaxID=1219383 RepID=A0A1G6IKQ1_9GAMM|nr:hypothetical protein [Acinetobacter boissieri]SDC07068.1 hypothetical protein SAMN05421733_108175 [Acinetobacter boissieri]